eukprot:6654918-Alexandrium_andersonii.AAC.1
MGQGGLPPGVRAGALAGAAALARASPSGAACAAPGGDVALAGLNVAEQACAFVHLPFSSLRRQRADSNRAGHAQGG